MSYLYNIKLLNKIIEKIISFQLRLLENFCSILVFNC